MLYIWSYTKNELELWNSNKALIDHDYIMLNQWTVKHKELMSKW